MERQGRKLGARQEVEEASAGRRGGDGEEWERDVWEDGLRVRGEGGRCLMSGLCTGWGAVHVLSRDPWAGLSFSWKNVVWRYGSQGAFRTGAREMPKREGVYKLKREFGA